MSARKVERSNGSIAATTSATTTLGLFDFFGFIFFNSPPIATVPSSSWCSPPTSPCSSLILLHPMQLQSLPLSASASQLPLSLELGTPWGQHVFLPPTALLLCFPSSHVVGTSSHLSLSSTCDPLHSRSCSPHHCCSSLHFPTHRCRLHPNHLLPWSLAPTKPNNKSSSITLQNPIKKIKTKHTDAQSSFLNPFNQDYHQTKSCLGENTHPENPNFY